MDVLWSTPICLIHTWATTKSQCNSGQYNGTGLEKYFKAGCSNDTGSGTGGIQSCGWRLHMYGMWKTEGPGGQIDPEIRVLTWTIWFKY